MNEPVARPSWWSQPVAAEGSTASEGIRRQLGKPRLDPLTVLVREAAQNSCDAALPGRDVQFAVKISNLTGRRLQNWRDFLLPEPAGSQLGLRQALDRDIRILTVTDRGTTGLGGPLRADEPPREDERADFVKFVRNVGERKNVSLGGGSYGFGKGIFYNVSRCHVIVVDSQCMFRGRLQRRLIGAAMGDGYEDEKIRFTGRHWLGVKEDGIAQALVDDDAMRVAESLGLPRFDDGATGTTVAVVDVDLGGSGGSEDVERTPQQAAEYLASTIAWNLWPRMIADSPGRLKCSVKFEGFNVGIPDPERSIELKPFVDAYRKLKIEGEYGIPPRKTPPTEIGRFAKTETMAPFRVDEILAVAAPFEGPARHCARMRQADLVVDYVAGTTQPMDGVQYGAVFKSSAEADQYFSDAEPPTHDDWVTSGLHGTALGVVRLANAFIRSNLNPVQQERNTEVVSDAALAPLANRLSGLLAAAPGGDGPDAEDNKRGAGKRRSTNSRSRPRITSGPRLTTREGAPLIEAGVTFPIWPVATMVKVVPMVVIDSGVEKDSELDQPEVLGWSCPTTGEVRHGDSIAVEPSDARQWDVAIRPPGDAVVRLTLAVDER